MRSTTRRALVLLGVTAALAACQAPVDPNASLTSTVVSDTMLRSEVDQHLAQSATEAANALQTLAMIQRTRSEPTPSTIDESIMPPELLRPTTLEWSGPAHELVKELAANVGYGFIETGAPPQKPVLANVNIRGVSAAKAFENVGLQVQAFATVIVDPNMKRVEFRNENAEQRQMKAPPMRGPALRAPRGHEPGPRPDVTK